ncbi:unnamed protein product [Acanthoscelides obtectus]|uniref:Uncharacterized protein n=1 Tax=Acanthoscelides obtectus TaxID=200917 RepID=A0A9P0JZB3_ACAOB|nr:unnamed protein product [Acanthoscelides obtectus]CAK1647008.1 hypothetical protein AOBTE_LOCUS15000 [Acanthoscelides obtectus]
MPLSMDTVNELDTAPGDSSGFLAMVAYRLPSKGPYDIDEEKFKNYCNHVPLKEVSQGRSKQDVLTRSLDLVSLLGLGRYVRSGFPNTWRAKDKIKGRAGVE